MAARLNIKNPHVVQLARDLAEKERKSVTAVIKEALQDMQDRQAVSTARELPAKPFNSFSDS